MNFRAFVVLCGIFFSLHIQASTIQPYENLGKMTVHTQTVVKATVVNTYTTNSNGVTHHRFDLKVDDVVKGKLRTGEIFTMQNYHNIIGDVERTIWGDINLEEGHTYLLFLDKHQDGYWRTVMLSYATFQEYERKEGKVMVPFGMGTEVNIIKTSRNKNVEPLVVYNSGTLISTLSNIAQGKSTWDQYKVAAKGLTPQDFNNDRDLPSYCTTLSGGTLARWRGIEETPLPVYYHEDLDDGCANTTTQFDNALTKINNNYSGLSLENDGSHDFMPSCSGGGATGTEFTNYVVSTYFDTRRHLVQFNDPCNEIPDLNGCSGTLAVGGLYWSNSTYEYLDETYRDALFGHVLVNNGSGACQCNSDDYATLLAHEITHGLNFGHISTDEGSANMNPLCCNDINNIDKDCVDALYPLMTLPVELIDFTAEHQKAGVKLSWSIRSEINSDYYTLERMNTSGNFQDIGRVQSLSMLTGSSYTYIDKNPNYGKNIYRLTQTDKDGHYQILKATTINIEGEKQINIYPNPLTSDELNIELKGINNTLTTIMIYNLNGRKVYSQDHSIENINSNLTIDMTDQPMGIYMVRVTSEGSTFEKKVVK